MQVQCATHPSPFIRRYSQNCCWWYPLVIPSLSLVTTGSKGRSGVTRKRAVVGFPDLSETIPKEKGTGACKSVPSQYMCLFLKKKNFYVISLNILQRMTVVIVRSCGQLLFLYFSAPSLGKASGKARKILCNTSELSWHERSLSR